MKETWSFIHEMLSQKKRVILLVVVDIKDSSPGQPGFKMAVSEEGELNGSIGGGQTEYRLVEMAKKELLKNDPAIFLKYEIHKPEAREDNSGMICSGEQWVAFYPLNQTNLSSIKEIEQVFDTRRKGMLHFNQDGFYFNEDESQHHKHKNPVTSSDEWEYTEVTGNNNCLYIFGAGHVGSALSKVMSDLDFEISIFDNRKELKMLAENKYAAHSQIVDYKAIGNCVKEGENSYVVIMTFGHKSDEVVLRQLLGKNLKYLGMMGSSKKVARIFENLRESGIFDDLTKKVSAPIGLPIDSQTPYEIAISIAGQIISVKNNGK